jgi:hypothetical protein
MVQSNAPYSRAEVLAHGHIRPERGDYCRRCKFWIPKFVDLSEEDEKRLRDLVEQKEYGLAMGELRKITGCSQLWAKTWALHQDSVHDQEPDDWPCPHCGMQLRSSKAKQCRHCHRDWHNVHEG